MNILLAAYSYIAALVGAGFASGQEILSFFVVHGKVGIIAIMLSSVIFGYFAYFILNMCRILNVDDYNALVSKAFKGHFQKLVSALIFVFTCVVYCVMLACAGEMLHLLYEIKMIWGSTVLSLVCALVLFTGKNSALRINGVLGAFIVLGICVCTLYMLRYREHQTFLNESKAIISGAGYAGYNLLGAGFTLAGLSSTIKSRRGALCVGIISTIAVFVMTTLIYVLLSIYYKHISLGEIPMLTMAIRQNGTLVFVYSVILVLAILSTAISSGFGVINMCENYINPKLCTVLLAISGVFASKIGFSSLINIVYRLCGYIGIFVIIALVCILNHENKKNRVN